MKLILASMVLMICSQAQAAVRTLYSFESKDCQACDEMKPILKRLERKGYKVVHIDVEKNPKLTKKYKVTHVPTYITVDKNGVEQGREVGVVSEGVLLALLKIARFLVYGIIRLIL